MPVSEYDWRIVANLLDEGSTTDGIRLVVSAGPGIEGTEWEMPHTTREAAGTMAETAKPVQLERGVTHSGLVTV